MEPISLAWAAYVDARRAVESSGRVLRYRTLPLMKWTETALPALLDKVALDCQVPRDELGWAFVGVLRGHLTLVPRRSGGLLFTSFEVWIAQEDYLAWDGRDPSLPYRSGLTCDLRNDTKGSTE